jgi:transposase
MPHGQGSNRTFRRTSPVPVVSTTAWIISGIIHVLRSGCRWKDCPPEYGPPTTVYNRFNLWSRRDHWRRILKALAEGQWITDAVAMDGSYVKAHRCAHGEKGGRRIRRSGYHGVDKLQKSTL